VTPEKARCVALQRNGISSNEVAAPDLAELVAYYQKQLRLQDWRLDVSYEQNLCSPQGAPAWGVVYPLADAKRAKILIRDPATPPDGMTQEQAIAQVIETVVHELLHLHFAPFGNTSQEANVAEEQAVWAIAEALIVARGTPEESKIAARLVAKLDARSRLVKSALAESVTGASMDLEAVAKACEDCAAACAACAAVCKTGDAAAAAQAAAECLDTCKACMAACETIAPPAAPEPPGPAVAEMRSALTHFRTSARRIGVAALSRGA
jgi:hypothetical protein